MGEISVLATWRAFELVCDTVLEPCCSLEGDASSLTAFEVKNDFNSQHDS